MRQWLKDKLQPNAPRSMLIAAFILVTAVFVLKVSSRALGNGWGTPVYTLVGVSATVWVAHLAHHVQEEIKNLLMGKVNSRHERTKAVIQICKESAHMFRAATFFPAVGVRDDPDCAPAEYLYALEEALKRHVDVALVSVPIEEARRHCEERTGEFSIECLKALTWIEKRLQELERRFPDRFNRLEVPGRFITLNVCFNESTALVYHMSMDAEDDGGGFKSTDARVLAVARGGFARYETLAASTAGNGGDEVRATSSVVAQRRLFFEGLMKWLRGWRVLLVGRSGVST